jgi:hypothetical protein
MPIVFDVEVKSSGETTFVERSDDDTVVRSALASPNHPDTCVCPQDALGR